MKNYYNNKVCFDNELVLPSITGKDNKDEKFNLIESFLKYALLKSSNKKNTGNDTSILVSCVDGCGKYSAEDHDLFLEVGKKIINYSDMIGKSHLIERANSYDLQCALQSNFIKNIFLIGHASYHSWRAYDKSVDWHDISKMTTHLKTGMFAVLGCGGITSWNMVPTGYFAVNNHENLYGYEAEYAYGVTLADFTKLKRLKRLPKLESVLNF